jgi:hypothetical protein
MMLKEAPVTLTRRCTHQSLAVSFETSLRTEAFADVLGPIFEDGYLEPRVLQIPDEFGPEPPRLLFQSRHGFSQIVVSQLTISLNAEYSEDFQINASSREAYVLERLPLLFRAAEAVSSGKLLFSGCTSRFLVAVPGEPDGAVLGRISEATGVKQTPTLSDLVVRSTHVARSLFYVNLTLQNYRAWADDDSAGGVLPRKTAGTVRERGLELLLDVNDRFAYNENVSFFTSRDSGSEILTLSNETATRELARIVGGMHEGR